MSPPTFPEDVQDESTTDGAGDAEPGPWPLRVAIGLAIVLGAGLLYIVAVLAFTGVRRAVRRRRADTPVARVALAWEESLEAARWAGVAVRRSATQHQAATQIGQRIPAVDQPIRALAATVEATAFAPSPPDEETASRALALADEVSLRTREQMGRVDRFRARFDPRLLRRR